MVTASGLPASSGCSGLPGAPLPEPSVAHRHCGLGHVLPQGPLPFGHLPWQHLSCPGVSEVVAPLSLWRPHLRWTGLFQEGGAAAKVRTPQELPGPGAPSHGDALLRGGPGPRWPAPMAKRTVPSSSGPRSLGRRVFGPAAPLSPSEWTLHQDIAAWVHLQGPVVEAARPRQGFTCSRWALNLSAAGKCWNTRRPLTDLSQRKTRRQRRRKWERGRSLSYRRLPLPPPCPSPLLPADSGRYPPAPRLPGHLYARPLPVRKINLGSSVLATQKWRGEGRERQGKLWRWRMRHRFHKCMHMSKVTQLYTFILCTFCTSIYLNSTILKRCC